MRQAAPLGTPRVFHGLSLRCLGNSFELLGGGIWRSSVCLDIFRGPSRFLWEASEVRRGVSARFLVDVWGCFPANLDFQRHPHPSPRLNTSGIQDSRNLRFNYAARPRFEDSVKHIFEDSWHAKVCEAWLPSVSETCCSCPHLRQSGAWDMLPEQRTWNNLRSLECRRIEAARSLARRF